MSELTREKGFINLARRQRIDDLGSAISHGLGFAMSGAFFGLLLWKGLSASSVKAVVSVSIYGACLMLMYLSSTLYHSFPQGIVKKLFRLLDHSSIFLCIAGSFTPVILMLYHGSMMFFLISAIWGLALLGIGLKIGSFCLCDLDRIEKISLILYLLMGWLAVLLAPKIIHQLGYGCFWFILGGGLAYSIGMIFYLWEKMFLHHLFWHLWIMIASALHFVAFFVFLY